MALSIGYFVSSHGLGHAARAAAVMEAVSIELPESIFHVFTNVAPWFFEALNIRTLSVHRMQTDVGLVQRDPFHEDIQQTIRHLDQFYPLKEVLLEETARRLVSLGCDLVLCDIAPLGIAASARAGIPSVLIENFTWDWIYDAYSKEAAALTAHIRYLESLFSAADYLIQTEPVCVIREADLRTGCVSRAPRRNRSETRRLLDVDEDQRLILVTIGGMEGRIPLPVGISGRRDLCLVFPGSGAALQRDGNILRLPKGPPFFFPDIVAASDAVVGKLGYSTLAEAFNCGVPFGYVIRERFPESRALADFLDASKRGLPIAYKDMAEGTWVSKLDAVLSLGGSPCSCDNGSHRIARFIASIIA